MDVNTLSRGRTIRQHGRWRKKGWRRRGKRVGEDSLLTSRGGDERDSPATRWRGRRDAQTQAGTPPQFRHLDLCGSGRARQRRCVSCYCASMCLSALSDHGGVCANKEQQRAVVMNAAVQRRGRNGHGAKRHRRVLGCAEDSWGGGRLDSGYRWCSRSP